MKFKSLIFFFIIISCTPQLSTINKKKPYAATGFVLVYNNFDYDQKTIKGRMNNDLMQISHQNLKLGTMLKITNPVNKKSVVLKNTKRIKIPEFYKLLITKSVSQKLNLNSELPILEIIEVKKNKSFIAEKAKIYKEEKNISSKAPIKSVTISNISKNKIKNSINKSSKIFILLGSFYSEDTANFLRERIIKETIGFDLKKLKLKKIKNKETQVIAGPYTSVNLLKNDYIKLKKFGFEELDVFINE